MSRLGRGAVAAFIAGVAVMLVFETTFTRILGVGLLFAGIALGVFAILTPEFLAGDDDA